MIGLFVDSSNKVWNTILGFTNTSYWFNPHQFYYTVGWIAFAALIIFFTYFYTSINFNPIEVADNLRKNGGQIPGVRPEKKRSVIFQNEWLTCPFWRCRNGDRSNGAHGHFRIVWDWQYLTIRTSVVIIVGVFVETTDKLSADMNAYRVNRFI